MKIDNPILMNKTVARKCGAMSPQPRTLSVLASVAVLSLLAPIYPDI
jgi:hypothetical protein